MLRLRGQGIAHPQTYHKGDQYVVFKIDTPARVSSKAKKLLEELKQELE
jgi:molecular chaperone DnaJ/curved DNA-binding protein